jgi:hypothetical protein
MSVLQTHFLLMDFIFYFLFFETEGRQASTKAHGAVDHLVSFLSSGEEIS